MMVLPKSLVDVMWRNAGLLEPHLHSRHETAPLSTSTDIRRKTKVLLKMQLNSDESEYSTFSLEEFLGLSGWLW
jgi:hypothetical protein